MTPDRTRALATGFLLLAVCGWAAAVMAAPVYDPDIWWHLNAGRWILDHGRVPVDDPFTIVREGYPYLDCHWLFQVIVWPVWRVGGAAGLVALKMLLGGGLALVLAWAVGGLLRERGVERPWLAAALAGVPVALALTVRPLLRPELLTLILLAFQLGAYVRFAAGRRRWGWAAAILLAQVAMGNVQGLFVLGWLLAGAFAVRAVLARRAVRGHLALVAAVVAVGLVNPYGWDGFTFPFVLWRMVDGSKPQFAVIGEFRRPLAVLDASAVLFVAFAALWLVALLRCRKDATGAFLLAFGGASVFLAFGAVRNLSVAAIPAGIGAAFAFPRVRIGAAFAAAAVLALLAADCFTGKHLQPWSVHPEAGFRADLAQFPVDATAYLDRSGFTGRRFVDINAGGWDAFARGRGARTFTDHRHQVIGPKGLETYLRMLQDPPFFEKTCDRFELKAAIFDRRMSHERILLEHCRKSPGWTEAWSNRAWSVFLRSPSDP